MSDSSQGPGWWVASDGKWYAPEQHPDARAAADQAEVTDQATPTTTKATESEPVDADAAEPAGEPEASDSESPAPAADEAVTAAQPPIATAAAPPTAETLETAEPGEQQVVAATTNIVAGLIALAGAAMIVVGSFLPWGEATGLLEGTVDGFDSNGVGTLIAGVVLAGTAGLLLGGVRHVLLLVAVLGSSLTALGLAIYSMLDITGAASDNLVDEVIAVTGRDAAEVAAAGTGLDVAYGLWIVLAGAAIGLISAAFVRFND
jgi:hypothetical protein